MGQNSKCRKKYAMKAPPPAPTPANQVPFPTGSYKSFQRYKHKCLYSIFIPLFPFCTQMIVHHGYHSMSCFSSVCTSPPNDISGAHYI